MPFNVDAITIELEGDSLTYGQQEEKSAVVCQPNSNALLGSHPSDTNMTFINSDLNCVCDYLEFDIYKIEAHHALRHFYIPISKNEVQEKHVENIEGTILCSKCYLTKKIDVFFSKNEMLTRSKRTRWDNSSRRLSIYRHYCMEHIIRPGLKDPCCWFTMCWCLMCCLPQCI